ncbi:hypothetical protein D3C78_1140980 [compost metagenome]
MRVNQRNYEHNAQQNKRCGGNPDREIQFAYTTRQSVYVMLKIGRAHSGVMHRTDGQPHYDSGRDTVDKHTLMAVT